MIGVTPASDPLLDFLAGGKDPSHVTQLNAEFSRRLAAMLADAPGQISITSGYRSPERQAQLWQQALAKYGSPEAARRWVAPPGRSRHNHGLAADLSYASPELKAWAHQNAPRYGLHFRMAHEPWHIELAPDVSPAAAASASAMSGASATPTGGVPAADGGGSPPMSPGEFLASGLEQLVPVVMPAGRVAASAGLPPAQAAASDAGPQDVPRNRLSLDVATLSQILDELSRAGARAASVAPRLTDFLEG